MGRQTVCGQRRPHCETPFDLFDMLSVPEESEWSDLGFPVMVQETTPMLTHPTRLAAGCKVLGAGF